MKLGEAIKAARIEKNLSLRELARRTGISHPYLSQLENGRNDKPSREFLFKLAAAIDLPITEFPELNRDVLLFQQLVESAPDELQAERKRNEYLARQVIGLQTNYDNQVSQNQFLTNELYNVNQVKDYYQSKWEASDQLNTMLMKQILSLKGE